MKSRKFAATTLVGLILALTVAYPYFRPGFHEPANSVPIVTNWPQVEPTVPAGRYQAFHVGLDPNVSGTTTQTVTFTATGHPNDVDKFTDANGATLTNGIEVGSAGATVRIYVNSGAFPGDEVVFHATSDGGNSADEKLVVGAIVPP